MLGIGPNRRYGAWAKRLVGVRVTRRSPGRMVYA